MYIIIVFTYIFNGYPTYYLFSSYIFRTPRTTILHYTYAFYLPSVFLFIKLSVWDLGILIKFIMFILFQL